MRKGKELAKKTISVLLALLIVISGFSVPAYAKEISWSIVSGVLYVDGSGKMENFGQGEAPWAEERGLTEVVIGDGITSVSDNAFSGITGLKEIRIPDSVTEIGENAFTCKVTCSKESKAAEYAAENGLKYRFPVIKLKESRFTFTGSEITPEVQIVYSDGSYLKADAELTYTDNTAAGTATVTADFGGIKASANYDIQPADISSVDISSREKAEYTGSARTAGLVMDYNGYRPVRNTDYTLSYNNNVNIGEASVTIIGKGNFTGQVTRYYEVVPAAVHIISLNKKEGNMSLQWKKAGRKASGYEIQISSDESFSEGEVYDIDDASAVKGEFAVPSGCEKCYVRIRVYGYDDSLVRRYSDWYEYDEKTSFAKNACLWLGCSEKNRKHRQIIDKYNSVKPRPRNYKVKYSDPWCATFVSAVAVRSQLTAMIPRECSCRVMINLLKKQGSWVEDDAYVPETGDIIFYDWQDSGKGDCRGCPDHVGIVVSVNGDSIKVIEGNRYLSSKKTYGVGYRTVKVNGRYIRGYGVWKN